MIVAGVDVGNSTTEVVVVDTAVAPPAVLAADRAPTRGTKGSLSSLQGAAVLVSRLVRRTARRLDLVAAAPQRPVGTRTVPLPQAAQATGRLDVVPAGGETPGGSGSGAGRPAWATSPPDRASGPVVLLVPAGTGYREAVDAVHRWTEAGVDVTGVLVADDEGVLLAARLATPLPVADLVDVDRVSTGSVVAVEVRPPGHPLQVLGDPLRLSATLGLAACERDDAVAAAAVLGDASRGVVVLRDAARPRADAPGAVVWRDGWSEPEPLTPSLLAPLPVGGVRRWRAADPVDPSQLREWRVDDLWAVGLREVAASVAAAVDPVTARDVVVAAVQSHAEVGDPGPVLGELLGTRVHVVGSGEAAAARAGAMTTPGVRSGALVVDLGGGTVDVVDAEGAEVVAAGAGELLTTAVARYLSLPLGAADWVKRGPCRRLESPQVALSEDGSRTFLDRPVDAAAVGLLAVDGPAGLLPFGASLAPAQWRSLRRRLKERVVADNVARALRSSRVPSPLQGDLLLVGGAAGDEELLGLLRTALPGAAVGRADVAGTLGHRYAVAYGLAVLATAADREGDQPT